jgi:hypothetical protein
MRRSRLALLAGSLLALLAAPTALAITPPGTVTVDTDGCSFTIHIDLDQQAAVVGWTVNASTEVDWNDGTTIFSGSGATDANGKLDVGPKTAAAGEYNVVVDDETPVDSSSIIEHFTLTCGGGSEAPIASAAAPSASTGTVAPSASTGTDLGVGGPPPTGEEEGLNGTGNVGGISVTPPPTDTAGAASGGSFAGSLVALLAVVALAGGISLLTIRRLAGDPIRRERRR